MNDERQSVFKNRMLFGGAIGASLSHEINNVFAIIGELSGLLEDLSMSREAGLGIDPTRIKSITERIEAQVERGKTYVKQLNTFSHSVDGVTQKLDAQEVVNRVVVLCERFARLRKVELETSGLEGAFAIEGDLFDLQHLLFRCIELTMSASPEGSSIGIRLAKQGEDVCFKFLNDRMSGADEDISGKISAIETIAKHLGGKFEVDIGTASPMMIALLLPLK